MRVNHNKNKSTIITSDVVSDLCKDTKMRVNHNQSLRMQLQLMLFLIYAKILK